VCAVPRFSQRKWIALRGASFFWIARGSARVSAGQRGPWVACDAPNPTQVTLAPQPARSGALAAP